MSVASNQAAASKPTSGGSSDASGVHLWLVLWKASRVLRAHAERSIAGLEMCQSDFAVLEALLHKGPLSLKDLGAKVLLTSGSITTAVDRLEERGLVERQDDKHDRRSRIVRLTEDGRTTIRKAFAEHKVAMERAAGALDRQEREQLIGLLRKLGRDAETQFQQDGKAPDGAGRSGNDGNEERNWNL